MKSNKNGVKLLAAVIAFAMVFCAAVAFIPSEDADATATELPAAEGNTITLESADYVLNKNIEAKIVVPTGVTATIDLAGFTISYTGAKTTTSDINDKSDPSGAIILVQGTLTIDDSTGKGSVIQKGVGVAAIHVSSTGKLTINDGNFRNTFDGEEAYYTLKNLGNTVINGGVFSDSSIDKENPTSGASVIANGYYNGSAAYAADNNIPDATMTINGGEFTGYQYVKNDDFGVMNIYGGTFAGTPRHAAIMNWGTLLIDDDADDTQSVLIKSLESTDCAVLNCATTTKAGDRLVDPGVVTVKSGSFDVGVVVSTSGSNIGTIKLDSGFGLTAVKIGNKTATATTGSISIGENSIAFDNTTISKLTITEGSINIEGDFVVNETGSVTITGVAKLIGDVTIPAGAELNIDSNAQLIINEGYTLTVEGTADVEGTIVNNGNIITKTEIDNIEGNEPSTIVGKVLTLKDFNGTSPISGDYEEIVLVGDNTITLDETTATYAINSGAASLTIKSIDGIGSLTIIVKTNVNGFTAISGKTVNINGVPVTITITGDAKNAVAISAEVFNIYDSDLTISVCEEDYTGATGIKTTVGNVDIKSSTITINAGSVGIDSKIDMIVAASDIVIEASESGITAMGKIMITNASTVDVAVYGLAESLDAVYGVIAASVSTQTDSVLTTDGMKIKGTGSQNNATVISDGDIIIEKGADYTNAGSFVNNATFGVYGTLTLPAGEFTNNGVLNTYTTYPGTISGSVDISVGGDAVTTIKIGKCIPLADGTFSIEATIVLNTGNAIDKFTGTLTYDGSNLSINAQSESAVLSVYKSSGAYKAFISGSVTIEGAESTTTVNEDATAVITNVTGFFVESEGTVTASAGKLTNNGSIVLNGTSSITGGEVVNDGTITLNKNITMSAGKMSGNAIIAKTGITVSLTGNVDMEFIFSGEYTEGTSTTPIAFTDTISVVGDVKGVVFTATNNETIKGTMTITALPASETASEVTVKTGKATFNNIVGKNVVLKVLSGSTLEIKTSATAKDGVIAIQDGAEILMKISGEKDTFKYGTLDYTISFANDGFTYYGSLQYALANAAEGATLNLNGTATIDVDTVVKKGITLQFGEGATLTVTKDAGAEKKTTLSMEEGASFVLAKSASIVIEAGKAVVSGTVVYDGNSIVLDKVEFTTADATFTSIPSTKTDASEISVTGTAVVGTITISEGIASGALTITDDEDANGTVKSVAGLVISEGAISKNVITDEKHTTITVDGTLNINTNQPIKGKITGDGSIILKDGVTITAEKTSVMDITIKNTDGSASVDLDYVVVADEDSETTMNIGSVAKTATKDAYIVLGGDIYEGTVTVAGTAGLSGFTINESAIAIVPADAVLNIISNSETTGLLKVAGTINMKIEGDAATATFGKLDYQITYNEDSYTVYTYLATGVNNAEAGDSFVIAKDLDVKTMEIPAGVTIEIAEGASLRVLDGEYITIGTAATTIGATTGISGKIVLDGDAFLIAYNDSTVDISDAKIVTIEGTTEKAAKNSQFTVLNIVYATVFVGLTTENNDVNDVLVPEIDGYRFVKWVDVDGKDMVGTGLGVTDKKVGEIDFDATMNASKVQVTFQLVEGLKYYVDGNLQAIVGAPVYVSYGSIITAVADSGYTGTPLVNGKAYITVTSDLKTVVGSGVSPAVDPTPVEPEQKDDGMGLTDILLIVLVILAAILVVIVAIRMMRS